MWLASSTADRDVRSAAIVRRLQLADRFAEAISDECASLRTEETAGSLARQSCENGQRLGWRSIPQRTR